MCIQCNNIDSLLHKRKCLRNWAYLRHVQLLCLEGSEEKSRPQANLKARYYNQSHNCKKKLLFTENPKSLESIFLCIMFPSFFLFIFRKPLCKKTIGNTDKITHGMTSVQSVSFVINKDTFNDQKRPVKYTDNNKGMAHSFCIPHSSRLLKHSIFFIQGKWQ